MLEKLGLPAKPSMRGSNWVVDASHCQGCSSQFTFINRKHHCRRCGGLFCNSCTLQRMVLRGQGDSPVRICEPCKKLEEAARFEMRYGRRTKTGKGSSTSSSRHEDDILNEILGNDEKEFSSSRQKAAVDGAGETCGASAVDEPEMGSHSPEELRQRALDEKKKYRILKGERKSEEALKALKRGKELERQADALEKSLRKNRRTVLVSGSKTEIHKEDLSKETGRKGKEKDDFIAELRQLGWSDVDLQEDNRSRNLSLESDLSSLLEDVSQKKNRELGNSGIGKSEVVALKRKAIMLKREGKLAEAMEELKKAKVLEKQLEEQEILGGAEDSDDDEISSLIQSMDDDIPDGTFGYDLGHGLEIDQLLGADDIGIDSNLDVTDQDLVDPEIAATLQSLGWTDDSDNAQVFVAWPVCVDREATQSEVLLLKREALNQKQAGNAAEAMALLKKAKLLEKSFESSESNAENLAAFNPPIIPKESALDSKLAPKSRMMIQKELLGFKKKALALRREGKLDEAEQELKKCNVLEQQLKEMDNPSKANDTQVTIGSKNPDLAYELSGISGILPVAEGEVDVTDQDMHDPTYTSLLRNLGWQEDDNLVGKSTLKPHVEIDNPPTQSTEPLATQSTGNISARLSRRSKAEIQRELLGLKRRALALRREGKTDEAEEVLSTAKALEAEMAELEVPKRKTEVESNRPNIINPLKSAAEEGDGEEGEVDVTDQDMHDPTYTSLLRNLGWQEDDNLVGKSTLKPHVEIDNPPTQSTEPLATQSTGNISARLSRRSKAEIQRELLGLKRRALALRREGKTDEAEEVLSTAKALEAEMAELEVPKRKTEVESNRPNIINPLKSAAEEGDGEDVTEEDMDDPALLSMLKNLGWKEEEHEPVSIQRNQSKYAFSGSVNSADASITTSSSNDSSGTQSSKREIQRELLDIKRKALAFRRKGEIEEAEELLKKAKLLEAQMEELEDSNREIVADALSDQKYASSQSLINTEKLGIDENAADMSKKSAVLVMDADEKVFEPLIDLGREESQTNIPPSRDADEKVFEPLIDLGRKESQTNIPPSWDADTLIPKPSCIKGDHQLSGEMGPVSEVGVLGNGRSHQGNGNRLHTQSVNMIDLLTGNDWNFQLPTKETEDKVNSGSGVAHVPEPHSQVASSTGLPGILKGKEVNAVAGSGVSSMPRVASSTSTAKGYGVKEDVAAETREAMIDADKKSHAHETSFDRGLASQNNQNSLSEEILAHKRRAVALKREGKSKEALEELRAAKLLEKNLGQETRQHETSRPDVSASVSNTPVVQQKESISSNLPPKALSGRDRFKLQQECLSHKRQAMKLRREGRMEEAEAEFQMAKDLEAQLELASQDSTKSSVDADDVVVEDFLDPQLLSALKAIGIEDTSSRSQPRPGPVKDSPPGKSGNANQERIQLEEQKNDNVNQERIQLEERIKAEKLKAVNSKRAGKNAEALDALRRAKLYEKKLREIAG